MAVTVYKSSDASAPVLTGLAGSLITVLDACLVNGYGSKAAAGWTIPYTGTNKRVYRAPGGAQHYFRVDDTAVNATALGREAQFRGYEAMTTVDAGTGPFPTTTQVTVSGLAIRKSDTVAATARTWVVVADSKTVYLFIDTPEFTGYGGYCFGEIFSLKGAGDAYRSILIGRSLQNSALDADDNMQSISFGAVAAVGLAGHYMPRHYLGEVILPVTVGKHGDGVKGVSIEILAPRIGNGMVAYPNPVDGSLMLSQVWIHDDLGSQMAIRGRMRGFWHFLHPVGSPVSDGDTFAGTGPLAGKTFLVIKPVALGDGLYVLETSDTWEVN